MSEWFEDMEELRGSMRMLEIDETIDVELILATILRTSQDLHESEARFRLFIQESSDGIWSATFGLGVPVDLPASEQAEQMLATSFIDYCNPAMARMYGFHDYQDMIRHPKADLMPPEDPRNRSYLLRFITSHYSVQGELTYERDRLGNELVLSNSAIGRVENGRLVRAWGVQRVVNCRQPRKPIHASAVLSAVRHRLAQHSKDQRLPDTVREDLRHLADACVEETASQNPLE